MFNGLNQIAKEVPRTRGADMRRFNGELFGRLIVEVCGDRYTFMYRAREVAKKYKTTSGRALRFYDSSVTRWLGGKWPGGKNLLVIGDVLNIDPRKLEVEDGQPHDLGEGARPPV